MSAVLSEAEIRARFAVSCDARGLLRTVCGYCGSKLGRTKLAASLAWFRTHDCVGGAETRVCLRFEADPCADLTDVPSSEHWKQMQPSTRSYGGRRVGLEKPTPERLAYERHVDDLLWRILAPNLVVLARRSSVETFQAAA